jgi:spore maturation protein CgeB
MLKQLNNILKTNKLIFNLNAHYKCKKVKKRYMNVVRYYNKKEALSSIDTLIDKNWGNFRLDSNKPKILWCGVVEQQDKSGFLQALEKIADVKYFTKENGDFGQYFYPYPDKDKSKTLNEKRLESIFIENEKKGFIPEIVMMQSWGRIIGTKKLSTLKEKYNFKLINIAMDDRHTFWIKDDPKKGVAGLLPILDLALTTAPEAVQWYQKENVPALFFPEGSSLDFYHPLNIEKKYDVGFVGANYGYRKEIVQKIEKAGINITTFGKGWENGKLPLDKTNEFFNQCKIVLGAGTIGYCKDFFSLKLRDFDGPLSGSMYITTYNQDLEELFEEDELVMYKTLDELVDKIKYNLENEQERKIIAKKGFEKVKNYYTYEQTLRKVFLTVGIDESK